MHRTCGAASHAQHTYSTHVICELLASDACVCVHAGAFITFVRAPFTLCHLPEWEIDLVPGVHAYTRCPPKSFAAHTQNMNARASSSMFVCVRVVCVKFGPPQCRIGWRGGVQGCKQLADSQFFAAHTVW